MSHDKIKKELSDIAPRLAALKEKHASVKMPEHYADNLYTRIHKKKDVAKKAPKTRYLHTAWLSAVAATIIALVMYVGLVESAEDQLPLEQVESFVITHYDEYELLDEEYFIDDDWITTEFEDIPEQQLVSYLEDNLDQFDIEQFIDIQY